MSRAFFSALGLASLTLAQGCVTIVEHVDIELQATEYSKESLKKVTRVRTGEDVLVDTVKYTFSSDKDVWNWIEKFKPSGRYFSIYTCQEDDQKHNALEDIVAGMHPLEADHADSKGFYVFIDISDLERVQQTSSPICGRIDETNFTNTRALKSNFVTLD